MAGKRVFICYAPEDYYRRVPVVAALDAWEVPHSEMEIAPLPWREVPALVGRAIEECEVFLRLCTPAVAASYEAGLATDYFRQLLERDRRQRGRGGHGKRALVNLILDASYANDPRDATRLYIATVGKERSLWLEELAAPLGVATVAQRVSRRAVLGMGAGAVVAVAASAGAGVLLEQQRQEQAKALAAAEQVLPVTQSSGQPRWSVTLGAAEGDKLDVPLLAVEDNTAYAWTSDGVVALSADGTKRQVRLGVKLDIFDGTSGATQMLAAGGGKLFLRTAPNTKGSHNISNITAVRPSDGKLLWQTAVADSGTPVVMDDMVYCLVYYDDITPGSTLSAFRIADGGRVWRQHVSLGLNFYPNPTPLIAAADGRVYAGSFDHNLYCFDGQTGKVRWQYKYVFAGGLMTLTYVGGTLYCLAGAEAEANIPGVLSLNALDGAQNWWQKYTVAAAAPPTVVGDTVYIVAPKPGGAYDSAAVLALASADGSPRWSALLESSSGDTSAISMIIVAGDRVLLRYRSSILALDATRGTVLWQQPALADISALYAQYPAPVVSGTTVYAAGEDGSIRALDLAAGTVLWTAPVAKTRIGTTPTLANGTLYAGAEDGYCYAVDARTGAVRWSHPLADPNNPAQQQYGDLPELPVTSTDFVASTPVVANGVVYIGGGKIGGETFAKSGDYLHALDAATGKQIWRVSPALEANVDSHLVNHRGIATTPLLLDGTLYVTAEVTTSGQNPTRDYLYAIDLATGNVRWSFDVPGWYGFPSSPIAGGGLIYWGSTDGTVYAVQP